MSSGLPAESLYFLRIQCFACAPRLVKTIFTFSFSTVVSVSAAAVMPGRGRRAGGNLRRLTGRSRHLRGLGRLGLRQSLGWRGQSRFGLEKILIAEQGNEGQHADNQGAAHVAAAASTAAAGALRLKIGIAKFWQRVLPIVKRRQTVGPPLVLW